MNGYQYTCDSFIGWFMWDITGYPPEYSRALDFRQTVWSATVWGVNGISGSGGGQFGAWLANVQAGHRYEVWVWCGIEQPSFFGGSLAADLQVNVRQLLIQELNSD
jgi:hypothetical protein